MYLIPLDDIKLSPLFSLPIEINYVGYDTT
jgi:hypothetical protein